MSRLSETILLAKVRHQNSAEAFAELYDAYVKRVYRFIYFKVRSAEDAEDITAEVFLKTWHYIREREAEIKSFSGLVYQIARTTIIDWYRRAARRPETVVLEPEEQAATLSDRNAWMRQFETAVQHKEILAALTRLKHDYQELVMLRYIEDLSIQEIADITGKTALTVRVTLHRALKKLEELVAPPPKTKTS